MSETPADIKVSDIIDWILYRLPERRHGFAREEIIDILLDLRQEFDR